MARTFEEKKQLKSRRRVRGRVDAIKKALDQEAECSDAIEGHIRFHVLDARPIRRPKRLTT
jgi:hypothetical protein